MTDLKIYRANSVLITVKIDDTSIFQNRVAKVSIDTPIPIDFIIGDYIEHNGEKFTLNLIPQLNELGARYFSYNLTFEGPEFTFYNKLFTHLGSDDFSFWGTHEEVLDLILSNVNEIDPTWVKGEIEPNKEAKLIIFNQDSCRTALTKLLEIFELELKITNKTVSLKKLVGKYLNDFTFEVGKGKGLYELTRLETETSSLFTRVYGYGGSTNIPDSYRSGSKRITFNERFIERNIDLYGVKETSVFFDDIFPHRVGIISGTPTEIEIIDLTIDFNLNDVIIKGQASIEFLTGPLGGKSFEIHSYDAGTKTIKINYNSDKYGNTYPNSTVKAETGDKYTLVGITMPQSYIDTAEQKVKDETIKFAESVKTPKNPYQLKIDELFIRKNNLFGALEKGDFIKVKGREVNQFMRIQQISYPLSNPSKITVLLSDKPLYTRGEQLLIETKSQHEKITVLEKVIEETGRDLSVRHREFESKVFDPDGKFDGIKIKPESIKTIHLSVGTRSQDFSLSTLFTTNFNGNSNQIIWNSGKLVHNSIDANAIRSWAIAAGSRLNLVSNESYYVYAKCGPSSLNGEIVIDTQARRIDDDHNYYYFLIGLLSSSITGVRWLSLSYGSTTVNGRFINTGRIQSNDEKTYFDLDSGIIGGRIKFGENGTSTIIDGNLVTTTNIILGNGIVNNAGFSGEGVLGTDIRLWAGKSYDERKSAPFRVDHDGNMFANNAFIKGHIEATSGIIQGASIIADNKFSLEGSRISILPEKGIKIKGNGYLIIPSIPPLENEITLGQPTVYELDGYLMLSGQKVKAGLADLSTRALRADLADYALDADKWDGRQFDDYLNQPVRKTDAVKFASVVADMVNSTVYVSGFSGSGYRINPDGSAEFDSISVRKELNINVLNVREITGNGGSLAITNVAKIKEVFERVDHWACHINTDDDNTIAVQFRVNDIVRCQVWDGKRLKYYSARVKAVSESIFDLDKASFVGAGIPQPGDTVFQFGNTTDTNRQGLIYMTNSDTGAPYLDVLDGITSDNLAGKTKVRLGKLDGINDVDFGQLQGYGLYGQNAYLTNSRFKGVVEVTGGNAATIAQVANAKVDAVSQAATTAQQKADAAQAAAVSLSKQLVDDLSVGGRNYVLGSSMTLENSHNWGLFNLSIASSMFSGRTITISVDYELKNATHGPGHRIGAEISFQSQNLGMIYIGAWFYPSSGYNGKGRLSSTAILPSDIIAMPAMGIYIQCSGDFTFVGRPKVEFGNKATDWTPAPEDVQSSIDNAKALANAAQAANTALVNNLKSMAYQDVVEWGKLGNTIIEGGHIKTSLLDATAIRAQIVNATYVQTLDLVAKRVAANQGYIGGFNIVNKSLVAGSNNDSPSAWDLRSANIMLHTDFSLFRKIGGHTSQTQEVSINLGYYPPSGGGGKYKDALVLKSNIRNTYGGGAVPSEFRHKNRALVLEAKNSDENIALEVMSGHIYLRGVTDIGGSQYPLASGYVKYYTNESGFKVLVLDTNAPPQNLDIPGDEGQFFNDAQTGWATKQGCTGYDPQWGPEVGSYHEFTVAAGTFQSFTSKSEANNLALARAQQLAQEEANNYGHCYYEGWTQQS